MKITSWIVQALLLLSISAAPLFGQDQQPKEPRFETGFTLVSAQVENFDPPIVYGPPKRETRYERALVLRLTIERKRFDELSPSLALRLHIGGKSYNVFRFDHRTEGRLLPVIIHIPDWEQLEEGATMLLTSEPGDSARDPKLLERQDLMRYSRQMITRPR